MISSGIWQCSALEGFAFDTDVFFSYRTTRLLAHRCVSIRGTDAQRYLRRHADGLGNRQLRFRRGSQVIPFRRGDPKLHSCAAGPDWAEPMMQGIPRPFRAEFLSLTPPGRGWFSRTPEIRPQSTQPFFFLTTFVTNVWHHFGKVGVHVQEGSWRLQNGYVRRRFTPMGIWDRRRLMRGSLAGARRAHATSVSKKRSLSPAASVTGLRLNG